MKLPDINYSVARPPAPYKKPEQINYWEPILQAGVDTFVSVKKAQDENEINNAAISLLQVNEELEANLSKADAINLDDNPFSINANERINSMLDESKIKVVGDSRWAATQDVINDAYDVSMTDAFNEITKGMSSAQKQQVKLKTSNAQIQTASALTKRKVELEVSRLSSNYKNNYDAYLSMGDWENAEAMASNAVATGAWTNEEYDKFRDDGRKRYYQSTILGELATAQNADDVNDITVAIGKHADKLGADNVRTLLSDANSRLNALDNQKKQRYDATQNSVLVAYMDSKLTTNELTNLLEQDAIDPSFALTMKNHLTTQARDLSGISDPQVMLNWNKKTATLGLTNGGQTSVTANYKQLNRKFVIDSTGIDPQNPSAPAIAPVLLGEDVAKVGAMLEKSANAVRRPQGFEDAVGLIKNTTGTAGIVNFGNKAQRESYNDYYRGLLSHIDREGVNADPIKWVTENEAVYTPDIYQAKDKDRFVRQFPQYKEFQVTAQRTKNGETRTVMELDDNRVKAKMMLDYKAGKLSKQDMEQQYYLLTGHAAGMDANSEDQQLFFEQLNGLEQ